MRIRPNFGIIGQIQPNTNASTGTVKTTADYINNIVTSVGISIGSGGITTTAGDYQIITFTGSGSFTPSQTGNVELMLIGGGGGGVSSSSSSTASTGASAGGMIYYGSQAYPFRYGTSISLSAGTTYTVTIGGGGATGSSGNPGGSSSLVGGSINLVAYGGARTPVSSEYSGGCGGAIWGTASHLTGNAAPSQGYPGSSAISGAAITYWIETGGAGLGGMAPGGSVQNYQAAAANGSDYSRGIGGIGFYTDISGSFAYYGAGGGGGLKFFAAYNGQAASSQLGGGGTAAGRPDGGTVIPAVNALPNTGSGGAGGAASNSGGSWYSGSAGGSGIVIIRYKFQ